MSPCHILVIEDDADISNSLSNFLEANGYTVSTSESAESASTLLKTQSADLILLDILLPGESGLDFCRRIHSPDGPPIIMVTALDQPVDNVVGLELGADDYVTKPFDLNVLLARIRAVLRRSHTHNPEDQRSSGEPVLQFSGFTFYPYRNYVRTPAGVRKPLTSSETSVLVIFCQHAKKILPREKLIEHTRAADSSASMRSVDLIISRLRRKLVLSEGNEELIMTFRNNGYMFRAEVRSL